MQIKLDDSRCKPLRANPTDAGMDLFSTDTKIIYPNDQHMFDTGVSVKIPKNFVGLVFNRSSQGKVRVQIANGTGVIDSDYRGNIKVILINNGHEPYEVNKFATRIAQLVIVPIWIPELEIVTEENWNDTVRGTGGFGSTGV